MTGKINNGGPAFPQIDNTGQNGEGMSLRDWLAGQAMAAIPHIGCGADLDLNDFAASAYQLADAMLAARKGGDA